MARVQTGISEKIYRIRRFLGVNEAEEGEATLKTGEAARMKNFRVTAGGALKKRGGSKVVAGLLAAYSVAVDTDTGETLLTEAAESSASLTMYPSVTVDSVGMLSLSGTAVEVTAANAASCVGYFYKDADGAVHKFTGITGRSA